jgi:hypothetical protein
MSASVAAASILFKDPMLNGVSEWQVKVVPSEDQEKPRLENNL